MGSSSDAGACGCRSGAVVKHGRIANVNATKCRVPMRGRDSMLCLPLKLVAVRAVRIQP